MADMQLELPSISLRLIPEAIQGLGDGSYPVSIILFSLAILGAVRGGSRALDRYQVMQPPVF
jgi:hypothetical protein